MSSFLKKLREAQATGSRRPHYEQGLHIAKVLSVEFKDGYKGESIILETEILASTCHEAGQILGIVFKPAKEMSRSNFKAFFEAASEENGTLEKYQAMDEDGQIEMLAASWGADQPFADVELGIEAVDIELKDGSPFTALYYNVLDEDFAERFEKMMAAKGAE